MKKEHLKNFGAGVARTASDVGFTAMKGFGKLSSAIGKRTTGNTTGGDFIQRVANKGMSAVDSKIGARANTKMGKAGSFVALTAAPVGRVVTAYAKGVKAAKTAATIAKARHATRVSAGQKSAETYKKKLPHTTETVDSKPRPIYPVRERRIKKK